MRIDGKAIAQSILQDLKERVTELKEEDIIPHLAIILVGNDAASEAYVRQKEKKAEGIGIETSVYRLPQETPQEEVLTTIKKLNDSPTIHGIIVQQPFPHQLNGEEIVHAVNPAKDVDGFLPDSHFEEPIAEAVIRILIHVHRESGRKDENIKASKKLHSAKNDKEDFEKWLTRKNIVVIGKGETGGRPIINLLSKLNIIPVIIDSKTKDPAKVKKSADILISAVGRPGIVKGEEVKKGAILICIGMFRGEDGKLHGDYEENDIKDIAGFYTPVPGGVGPVNVAMLLENVIIAAEK